MADGDLSYLRLYVAELVRIWTALSLIRNDSSSEMVRVFRDLCSDKLRIMLHELANKRSWTLGFAPDGTSKNDRLFAKLCDANTWFAGYKNGLHYRNCSGAHMQPLDRTDHMFQQFGYGGDREWSHLTKGVAACLAMMRLVDGHPRRDFWRKVRAKVRGAKDDAVPVNVDGKQVMCDMPVRVQALLESFRADE